MLFNSLDFLLFFPIVTALYYFLPTRFQWALLLIASCIFYMDWIPKYILILFFIIAVDFVAGSQFRAPLMFQRTGLEWAWRLASNPRRLAKRYADCAGLLFDVAVLAPVRQQITGREI